MRQVTVEIDISKINVITKSKITIRKKQALNTRFGNTVL